MNYTLEIVNYMAKSDVSDSQILELSSKLQDFLLTQNGLVSRTLAKSSEGVWSDVVIWISMEDAKAAAKNMEEQPLSLEFMGLVEVESLNMQHLDIKQKF